MENAEAQIAALQQRLEQLEAQMQQIQASGAAPQPGSFRTPFTIVGSAGQKLLDITTMTLDTPDGLQEHPCLCLYNAQQQLAAMLYATTGGAGLTLTDAGGYEAASVTSGAEGGAVRVRDGGLTLNRTVGMGQHREVVRIAVGGAASVEVYNDQNMAVGRLGVNAHGGTLSVTDHEERPAAVLAAGTNGGNLLITESSGQLRAWLSADVEGGRLELFDTAGDAVYTRP